MSKNENCTKMFFFIFKNLLENPSKPLTLHTNIFAYELKSCKKRLKHFMKLFLEVSCNGRKNLRKKTQKLIMSSVDSVY